MKIPVWRQQAACREVNPDIFYPRTEEESFEAKRVCGSCLVQEECLDWALSNREQEGVWGGTTERERRRIVRQRRKSA